jgi:solute carrier family 35 (UDP-sugar transporter), member A1/2/3
MLVLAILFGAQPVLTAKFTPRQANKSSIIFIQECVKLCIGTVMFWCNNTRQHRTDLIAQWNPRLWVRVAFIPAALYCLHNILCLHAYQNLDSIVFNVVNQSKILSSAFCCYLILGQKQSAMQVISLFVLMAAVLVMGTSSSVEEQSPTRPTDHDVTNSSPRNLISGLVAILGASLISGFAGTIVQTVLQHSKTATATATTVARKPRENGRDPYLYSIELSTATLLLLLVSFLTTDDGQRIMKHGFFADWNIPMLLPILTNSTGGIVVGLVIKHAGVVRKGLSTILGIFISGAIQTVDSSSPNVCAQQAVGAVLAGLGLWMNLTNPKKETPKPEQTVGSERAVYTINRQVRVLALITYTFLFLISYQAIMTGNFLRAIIDNITESEGPHQMLEHLFDIDFSPPSGTVVIGNSSTSWYEQSCKESLPTINEGTDILLQIPLTKMVPWWVDKLCPEVAKHFEMYPSFSDSHIRNATIPFPLSSTSGTSRLVCTTQIVQAMVASLGSTAYIHAGTQLSAALHGQPFPWDDDADVFMPFDLKWPFYELCKRSRSIMRGVILRCNVIKDKPKSIKVWVEDDSKENTGYQVVDVFMYKVDNGVMREVNARGKRKTLFQPFQLRVSDFFPSKPYYYAGSLVMGRNPKSLFKYYGSPGCYLSTFNHQLEMSASDLGVSYNTSLDCCRLAERFPFAYDDDTISNGAVSTPIFPENASLYNEEFVQWLASTMRGNFTGRLTPIPKQSLDNNRSYIEVDNTIASNTKCLKNNLNVVYMDAFGGDRWLEFASLLGDADIVILRSMAIGVASSGQQHVTRLLAHKLGMNYVWGFDHTLSRNETHYNIPHLYGLHGHAMLSRCRIVDPYYLPASDRSSSSTLLGTIQSAGKEIIFGIANAGALVSSKTMSKLKESLTLISVQAGRCEDFDLESVDILRMSSDELDWSTAGELCVSGQTNVLDGALEKPQVQRFGFNIEVSEQPIQNISLDVTGTK